MARIYISSTFEDLKDERAAVARAIRRLGHQAIAMEDYVAEDEPPLTRCLADVRDCQLYVGIVAWRYGVPLGGQHASVTELEYQEAGNVGIPRLIFVLDAAARWPPGSIDRDRTRIDRFRGEVTAGERHLVSFFRSPEDLAEQVSAAVSRALTVVANRVPIPQILPYLCDRSDQESELGKAWNAHQIHSPRRPFICIVFGDELECHDAFVERLHLVTLPTLLGGPADMSHVRQHFIPWRSGHHAKANRVLSFRKNLQDSVAEAISREGDHTPLLLHTYLLSEDWLRGGRAMTDAFLEFWSQYPDVSPRRHLFVCFCLRHQRPPRSYVGKLLTVWANWNMRKFLRLLTTHRDSRIGVVRLPELTAIRRGEAEEWIRTKPVKEVCDVHRLIAEVRSLYDNPELCTADGHIPMERLAPELRRLLLKHRL